MKFARRTAIMVCHGLLLLAAPALQAATPSVTAAALPSSSIYQLPVPLLDQNDASFRLDQRRGQPILMTMFYSSCQYACPTLITTLKNIRAKLSPEDRKHLSALLVSFDPARDDGAKLRRTADEHGLDLADWTLARADSKSARKLAAVLGIQYRALPDGDFNHTSVLLLIDAEGRIAGRTSQMGSADPKFVKLVQRTVRAN